MPSPQKRKRKHLANRKFPRKQSPWDSHRPTPDGAVHHPDGTTNITSQHRMLKKKKVMVNRVDAKPVGNNCEGNVLINNLLERYLSCNKPKKVLHGSVKFVESY